VAATQRKESGNCLRVEERGGVMSDNEYPDESTVNTKSPCFTYIIHGANGKPDRTVTVYKPTRAYYLVYEIMKFRRFPAVFPDIGITVLSENQFSKSDSSVTQNTNPNFNNHYFNNH